MFHSKMDEKDSEIISALQLDSRLSLRELAKKTGLPMSTVHHRLNKLVSSGVIRNFTISLDNAKAGLGFSAYVLISVDLAELKRSGRSQKEIAHQLRRTQYCEKVAVITGESDLIALVRTPGVTAFNSLLQDSMQKIEGIAGTRTLVILDE